jgi:hypothetical protein
LGLPPEHSSAANPSAAEEEEEEEELGRDAQATQATVQNEPTAGEPVASVGPAEGSGAGAGADAPPDPQEMAELRKITDRLARCRPSEIGDDDDDAYDE